MATQQSSPIAAVAAAAPPPTLDLERLLGRAYQPSGVARLRIREAYRPPPRRRIRRNIVPTENDNVNRVVGPDPTLSHLVLKLIQSSGKPVRDEDDDEDEHARDDDHEDDSLQAYQLDPPPAPVNRALVPYQKKELDPAFLEVELSHWESQINWDGLGNNSNNSNSNTEAKPVVPSSSSDEGDPDAPSSTAMALLGKLRNPHLDALQFDETTVVWNPMEVVVSDNHTSTTTTTTLAQSFAARAAATPLLLDRLTAGRSVARTVHQQTVQRRRLDPAVESDAYRRRMHAAWGTSEDDLDDLDDLRRSKKSLHANKQDLEALIQARQKKRAQMAKDKTNRVTEAMGKLAVGGGRGRTITSSLMGPGGTERTGRPSRGVAAWSATHESEYVEQLEMIQHHAMVRGDWSKVVLRQSVRPKLPLSVVRLDGVWQLQIRYGPPQAKVSAVNSAYQGIMMGTHAGAVSKAKLRTENDLTPSEGHLVVLEYMEESPPILMTKGMACKIVNYYRGDRSRCPVSRGGGDQPARRKRVETNKNKNSNNDNHDSSDKPERRGRLEGPQAKTKITDWVGQLPKVKKSEKEAAIDILPEGVTEMLHPKVHGPFIGEIEEGRTLTGLVSNLFVAPMVRHEPESTDFLMVLTPPSGASRPGQRESMGVILRELPSSIFTVGQTEPRARVYAPNTQGEKNFVGPFVSYQIARTLTRMQAREGHGLRFDELQDRVLPNLDLPANALRQRLKQVAVYDKNTQIWTTKAIGYEDYPGVDALGKQIAPEGVAAFETACAASRRLSDLGIHQLLEKGSHTVMSVGVAMVYLAGQLNAAREASRKMKKLSELVRSNKNLSALQAGYYERAAAELESNFKVLRQRYEVAQFIYEELQLAPWHLTGEFLEVHKKGEGTGMMKLTGLGDPSGRGEGFSFLREVDSKPSKSIGTGALNAQMKKITGTEDDLRKLTMRQMAALLRSYGMADKDINTLKRWDRVHVIRDLSTKAASDGIGDGLERFARGEKMKLSEQRRMYRERIQVIWKRMLAALADSGDRGSGEAAAADGEADGLADAQASKPKKADGDKDNSDSDSEDDDDLAAALEDEMMDRSEANQIVAEHSRGDNDNLGQLRAATQDQDLTKDAQELAALKRQREEERVAQEGMLGIKKDATARGYGVDRKVIRKKIVKTHPDGRQTTTFKFILHPEEVGKIMAKLNDKNEDERPRNNDFSYEYGQDERPPGHAMFEDEDDFEYSSKSRMSGKRRGAGAMRRGRGVAGGRVTPRGGRNLLQIGKLKTKVSKEDRMRKRKREEEELEVYVTSAKRRGTSNRRERGSIRDRRPHVIFADKLEAIRASIEARQYAGPFLKPVNRRLIPRYYEVISHPIDLSTIKDKISRYEYRTADALVRDFDLMKSNAVKFNGQESPIAQEAVAICDYVREQVDASREEMSGLEEAVKEQMSGKPKKKRKPGKKSSSPASGTVASVGGVDVNLGDLSQSMHFDGIDSDSDESFSDILNLQA